MREPGVSSCPALEPAGMRSLRTCNLIVSGIVCEVEVGSVADVHFEVGDLQICTDQTWFSHLEVGEDGRRSTSTDIGIILSDPIDGRVQVQFQDFGPTLRV